MPTTTPRKLRSASVPRPAKRNPPEQARASPRSARLNRRALLVLLGSVTAMGSLGIYVAQGTPVLKVYKDRACGCCRKWASHIEDAGIAVRVVDTDDMMAIKRRLGVPDDLQSCHTAEISGYVIEGHVPAAAVKRLLSEAPEASGLAVPGMPVGSPGMEGGAPEVYDIVLFGPRDSWTFGRFRGATTE